MKWGNFKIDWDSLVVIGTVIVTSIIAICMAVAAICGSCAWIGLNT